MIFENVYNDFTKLKVAVLLIFFGNKITFLLGLQPVIQKLCEITSSVLENEKKKNNC